MNENENENENEMVKMGGNEYENVPMSIAYDNFLKSITSLINNCMLPPFVIELILKNLYEEMNKIAIQQLKIDREHYVN